MPTAIGGSFLNKKLNKSTVTNSIIKTIPKDALDIRFKNSPE